MRNNYSDIAFGYPSNSVTALMKIKASSTNISKKVYHLSAIFMFVFINKMIIKLILLANFFNYKFIKLILLANFFNYTIIKKRLLANFCNYMIIETQLLANFFNYKFIKKASKEVLYLKYHLILPYQVCILPI